MKEYKRVSTKWEDFQGGLNFMVNQGWKLHSWFVMKDFAEDTIVLAVWEKG